MEKEVILVGGLGFGDEGKGSIVDYLVRAHQATLVVRYSGGAQAGHNVVTPDGLHHTFSQFGSGTLIPGVETYLSRFMVINPLSMIKEEEHLRGLGIKDAFHRITIDRGALVTTPFQIAVNRLREIWRGDERHGSCGIGIGQTVEDYQKYGNKVLFAKDLSNPEITTKKLEFLQKEGRNAIREMGSTMPQTEAVAKELAWLEDKDIADDLARDFCYFTDLVNIVDGSYFADVLKNNQVLIFEGAQGVLLDRKYGFYPYVTKSDTTFANAHKLLEEAEYRGEITRIGVLRGYATRHGAGPFVTENNDLAQHLRDPHNQENQWQGRFKIGWFDLLAIRYGISVNGVIDYLALTNLDQLSKPGIIKVCVSYEYEGELDVLSSYFQCEPIGGKRARILAFRKPDINTAKNNKLAQILFRCKPLEFIDFHGWQEYINFLQSQNGLNTPIRILSFSPTWEGKILIN